MRVKVVQSSVPFIAFPPLAGIDSVYFVRLSTYTLGSLPADLRFLGVVNLGFSK